MKKITRLILALPIAITFVSCSNDDNKATQVVDCECYYTLVEGGQHQEGWTQPSDSTDCNLNGVHVYYDSYMNGQPNETFYRILHCE